MRWREICSGQIHRNGTINIKCKLLRVVGLWFRMNDKLSYKLILYCFHDILCCRDDVTEYCVL